MDISYILLLLLDNEEPLIKAEVICAKGLKFKNTVHADCFVWLQLKKNTYNELYTVEC